MFVGQALARRHVANASESHSLLSDTFSEAQKQKEPHTLNCADVVPQKGSKIVLKFGKSTVGCGEFSVSSPNITIPI